MAFTVTVTEDDVLKALGDFLTDILPAGTAIIRAQNNLVPEPAVHNFVTMTPTLRRRLSTNVRVWDVTNPSPTSMVITQAAELTIQLDVHGGNSTDNAQLISTLFRDQYAVDVFAQEAFDLRPLYCDDGQQMPFINAENQYEDRWVMNVVMQANPLVSTPQQFADTITIGLIEVDAYYPPNLPLLTFVGNNGLALTFVGSNGGAVEFSGT